MDAVVALVRNHLRTHQADIMTSSGIRRYVRDAEPAEWQRLGAVSRADCTSKHAERRDEAARKVDELEEALRRVGREDARRAVRGPIGGREIGERYGLPQGVELGRLVKAVVAATQEAWDRGEELSEDEAWEIAETARRSG